jgi:hypothetical protein
MKSASSNQLAIFACLVLAGAASVVAPALEPSLTMSPKSDQGVCICLVQTWSTSTQALAENLFPGLSFGRQSRLQMENDKLLNDIVYRWVLPPRRNRFHEVINL